VTTRVRAAETAERAPAAVLPRASRMKGVIPAMMAGMIRRSTALFALALITAACGASPDPVERPDAEVAVDTAPPLVVGADEGDTLEPILPLLPGGVDVVAIPLQRFTTLWDDPERRGSDFLFDTQNPMGQLSPMLIEGAEFARGDAWYEVFLPLRPNGATAWVNERDVQIRRIDYRIEVDLSQRTLRYFVDDKVKERFRVGIGTDATPTGRGRFYVWVKVYYADPYQAYGIGALGLSGFSPVLSEWPGGGRMAIHGTSNPGDRGRPVSHGCIRVYNDDLRKLLDVPLGTPVEIRA
jgi:L,D-transpeptidase catalytic domain